MSEDLESTDVNTLIYEIISPILSHCKTVIFMNMKMCIMIKKRGAGGRNAFLPVILNQMREGGIFPLRGISQCLEMFCGCRNWEGNTGIHREVRDPAAKAPTLHRIIS